MTDAPRAPRPADGPPAPRLLTLLTALFLVTFGLDRLSGGAFLASGHLRALVAEAGALGLMALGAARVLAVGRIDLSPGGLAVLAGTLAAILAETLPPVLGGGPAPLPAALAAGLGLGVLAGGLQGALAAGTRAPAAVVTLGGLLIAQAAAEALAGAGGVVLLPDPAFRSLDDGVGGSAGAALGIVALALLARPCPAARAGVRSALVAGALALALLVAALTAAFVLGRPRAGPATVGRRRTVAAFALAGGTAALAGLFDAARLGAAAPGSGLLGTATALAVARLGGASPAGTLLAALLVQSLLSGTALLGRNEGAGTPLLCLLLVLAAVARRP